jgi:aspartokinase/homoserine dehydrogenase 1
MPVDRVEVHKFGGTSVAGADRMVSVAKLVVAAMGEARVVVVTSAMAGVTDALMAIATVAGTGDRDDGLRRVDAMLARHLEVLSALDSSDAATDLDLRRIASELSDLVRGASLLCEMTARTRDRMLAAGEKLAVRLLAVALRCQGVPARALDADDFLETDDRFGAASPLAGVADRSMANAIRPVLAAGEVPVVTGFCGRAPDGATTTLGRGGSDLSATLVAAALGADEVTIWTDVDGVYGADPRIVPETRTIPQLNYREAAEMSYYGAKVLHQRTMIPVASRGIPVRVRNSLLPFSVGTIVDGRFTRLSHPVKAITAVRDHCLVSVEGKGMSGVPGVSARVFRSLADRQISVTMISQSSSESSICLAVPAADAALAEAALKREFRADLSAGDIEDVVVRQGVGLVAAVGIGMSHTPGVAARLFGALGVRDVNILAMAQGSSELNISLAVTDEDVDEAVRAVHLEFGLHRIDVGVDSPAALDLVVLGCGKVGRALVRLVLDRQAHVFERFGREVRIVAIADRSGYMLRPAGISREGLEALMSAKAAGRHLADLDGAVATSEPLGVVAAALAYRLSRPILIDVTDCEGNGPVFLSAFASGCDVVTANKKVLAGTPDSFKKLTAAAVSAGRLVKAEATVGAGLPIVDTLEMLLASGDRLVRAEGALSGTLGFVTTRLEEGVPLSEAVAEAAALGYTEPDPAEDLSGADVARKALILGRLSGLATDVPVKLIGLVEDLPLGLAADALYAALRNKDAAMAERVATARDQGRRLRFLASVQADLIEVGPVEVPVGSPFAGLRGTDNQIVFVSDRYRDRPLVISGPGAGVDVTAMAVLCDVFRIAAERR